MSLLSLGHALQRRDESALAECDGMQLGDRLPKLVERRLEFLADAGKTLRVAVLGVVEVEAGGQNVLHRLVVERFWIRRRSRSSASIAWATRSPRSVASCSMRRARAVSVQARMVAATANQAM